MVVRLSLFIEKRLNEYMQYVLIRILDIDLNDLIIADLVLVILSCTEFHEVTFHLVHVLLYPVVVMQIDIHQTIVAVPAPQYAQIIPHLDESKLAIKVKGHEKLILPTRK